MSAMHTEFQSPRPQIHEDMCVHTYRLKYRNIHVHTWTKNGMLGTVQELRQTHIQKKTSKILFFIVQNFMMQDPRNA